MGWFWANDDASIQGTREAGVLSINAQSVASRHHRQHGQALSSPPPGCPMHEKSAAAMKPKAVDMQAMSTCSEIPQDKSPEAGKSASSRFAKYNPLNFMFSDISQEKAQDQTYHLPLEREPSTIPKGSGDGNWEYPSPQQMYNALLRKGYKDTDVRAVESMVSIHNFLNEGAWAEIVEHERRFCRGLARGWSLSKRGEANAINTRDDADADISPPSLVRFQGRPTDMTPKATMLQVLGWIYPGGFGTPPPFDRHDWYVARDTDGKRKEIRYVIDYYEGPDEPSGDPVFFIDVRPAMTPRAATERLMRWGGDIWYRASGKVVREQENYVSNPVTRIVSSLISPS